MDEDVRKREEGDFLEEPEGLSMDMPLNQTEYDRRRAMLRKLAKDNAFLEEREMQYMESISEAIYSDRTGEHVNMVSRAYKGLQFRELDKRLNELKIAKQTKKESQPVRDLEGKDAFYFYATYLFASLATIVMISLVVLKSLGPPLLILMVYSLVNSTVVILVMLAIKALLRHRQDGEGE